MAIPQISRTTKIILTVEFIVFAYMLYVLSSSLYKSYQIERVIQRAAQENAELAEENTSLAEDYEYYRSDAYKEKIAKQNFGLVRPGEEVIIVTPDDRPFLSQEEKAVEVARQYYDSLSNYKKWFLFFFERERLEL